MRAIKLYGATGALVAGMDKRKAAKQAAAVAFAVANGNGAPGMRVVARVVAHTLTAIGDRQADGAAAVTPVLDSGSDAGPVAEPAAAKAAGWEQAVRAVQKLRQAGSGAQTAAPEHVSDADAALPTERLATAAPAGVNLAEAQDEARARAYPSAAPEPSPPARQGTRGSLAGDFDVANIGAYAFSLYRSKYNVQLQVNQLRASGNVGGQFSLGGIPEDTWHRLLDRGNRVLPVWVLIHDCVVEVQVDDGPADAPRLSPTDMLPKVV
jgi:hypothetical protein